MSLFETVNAAVHICEAVEALGGEVWRRGTSISFACPACGAERRHSKSGDHRGAVGVGASGGARCFQCGVGFDVVAYTSWRVGGASWPDLPEHKRAEVREALERLARVDHAELRPPSAARPAPRPVDAPLFPPLAEVAAAWNESERVDRVQLAEWYLRERCIDATAAAALDMVRVLPSDPRILPSWAQGWARSEHRLIFALFDARGDLRSVLARLTRPTRPGERKSLAPAGFARAGLAVACPAARAMLRATCHPTNWCGPSAMRLALCEGEIDALCWATRGDVDATIGLFTGSFSAEHARRLAWGARVLVATDLDEAGDELAKRAAHELREASRTDLEVTRWTAAA